MRKLALFTPLILAAATACAQTNPDWTTPIPPFQIADNLYYVGSRDLASYLITTRDGDILINGSLASSPSLIRASVEKLGFRWTDIRILLNGQAHVDHVAGNAEILHETHARQMVMEGDAQMVERGGAGDFTGDHYTPSHVDRVLHDGDTVTLGNVTLTALKTAGHTRGCTTWTFHTTQHGQPRSVVILGGWSPINYRLIATPGHPAAWPTIVPDFEHTFAVLHPLHPDIFLGAHGMYFNMLAKLARRSSPTDESVWIDPGGYQHALNEAEHDFHKDLAKQQAAP
jgi:metallo-beta-lactamase class B